MSEPIHISHIIEGKVNQVLDKLGVLPDDIKRMSELRFADCLLCEHTPHPTKPDQNGPGLVNGKYCNKAKGGCGCDMDAKTKVNDARCPIGRW